MADPTILRGSDYFFTNLYEGNGGGQRVGNFVPFTDNGTIDKSVIFDNGGPAYLNKTYGSAGTSLKKFTFSCWFKIGVDTIAGTSGYFPTLFNVGGESGKYFSMFIQSQYQNIQLYSYNSTYDLRKITNRTFEDTSKWYHIVCAIDTTETTGSDRVKLYIDGDRITSFSTSVDPSQDYDLSVGAAEPYYVGFMNSGDTWDGYIAEANYVDGTALTPSTFGLTDTSTGRWIPKTLTGITYGSNGFRMQFANSAGQTIGDDTSGNGNDFTVNNMDAADVTTDSPTQNHTTLNRIKNSNITISEGNLRSATVSGGQGYVSGSDIPLTSGKYYSEITITNAGSVLFFVGVGNRDDYLAHYTEENPLNKIEGGYIRSDTGQGYTAYGDTGTYRTYGSSYTTNDIIGIAVDVDKGAVWISKNNTWYNSASVSEIENGNVSNSLVTGVKGPLILLNYTHNGTTLDYNFGQKGFEYTPPTGYNAIQQDNLPETSKGIPDFVWIKNRDATDAHQIYDSNRGPLKDLNISTVQESTTTDGLQKFLKGGFAIEDDVSVNTSGESYVSWNWLNNGGTTSTNEVGSIDSTTQVNSTAGFSIIQHTGNGTNGATIGHGLSQAPTFLITKNTSTNNRDWMVWHHKLTNGSYFVDLNNTEAQIQSTSYTNSTAPSSTVITLGTSAIINGNGESYVTYAFHEVRGYSKFGSYTGNGSSDGTFVYTGFKPSWLMIKRTNSSTGAYWTIQDSERWKRNPLEKPLLASSTDAESGLSDATMDFLSNGFKIRNTLNSTNASGSTYIFMAFAEHPFAGTSSINPVTAR